MAILKRIQNAPRYTYTYIYTSPDIFMRSGTKPVSEQKCNIEILNICKVGEY